MGNATRASLLAILLSTACGGSGPKTTPPEVTPPPCGASEVTFELPLGDDDGTHCIYAANYSFGVCKIYNADILAENFPVEPTEFSITWERADGPRYGHLVDVENQGGSWSKVDVDTFNTTEISEADGEYVVNVSKANLAGEGDCSLFGSVELKAYVSDEGGTPGCFGPARCLTFTGQVPDCDYQPSVQDPVVEFCSGPRIFVDTTHGNFHHITPESSSQPGRYWGFASLLFADGYQVLDSTLDLTDIAASGARILVIASPTQELTTSEQDAVLDWVADGGRLLLIFDHDPFDEVANLLASFGYEQVEDETEETTFTRASGTLSATSPVTAGRNEDSVINEVTTFNGSSFRPNGPTPALVSSVDEVLTFTTGDFQAVGLQYGTGRVYISGEAASLTAQTGRRVFGMHVTPDNEQYLRNIVHWLDDLIPAP